jgi:hypothetical protein
MTILIIFDRKNHHVFRAKSFRLKNRLRNKVEQLGHIKNPKSPKSKRRPSISTVTDYPDYLSDTASQTSGISFLENPLSGLTNPKEQTEEVTNHFIDPSQIMSENMELENIHLHKPSEFGSYNFVIRSKRADFANHDTRPLKYHASNEHSEQEDLVRNHIKVRFEPETQLKTAPYYFGNSRFNKINNTISSYKINSNYDTALSAYNQINHISAREKKFYNTYQIPKINNETTSDYIRNIYRHNNPFVNTNSNDLNDSFNCMSLSKFQTEKHKFNNQFNSQSFVYNKVSSDIYSKLGRAKPSMVYPQQIKNSIHVNSGKSNLERPQENIVDEKNQLHLSAKDFFLPKIF